MAGWQRLGNRPRTARQWTNWAGTASATPARVACPRTVEEIVDAVRHAAQHGLTVRPRGAGHSFTDIAATSDVAIDLRHWRGVVTADVRTGLVTVRSGTPLHQLNLELDRHGLAMANLGDIDAQTVAGAISTGTHGTGSRLGGLATQVAAVELVLADGSLVRCSADERPELFQAARVGLGALGVLTTVTLRCVPAFVLAADERPQRLDEVLDHLPELAEHNDHFEFYWFPYGRNALVKRNNRLPAGQSPQPLGRLRGCFEYEVMENAAFGTLCRVGRAVPPLARPLQALSSAALSTRHYSDRSYRVFATTRRVRFVESEYAVPRAALPHVLAELRARVPRLSQPVMFPVEVRVASGDDIWLSTAHGRDTAYVAVHQYVGMPYREYFDLFEAVAGAADGRPHWGKLHRLDAAALGPRYPRFADFQRVRAEVDPQGRFRNAYLDRVLGTPDTEPG